MTEQVFANAPYVVDQPTYKVQTLESNGEQQFVFQHEFKRLDATNFPLLVTKEKNTVRMSQSMGRNKRRPRFDETKADSTLYKEIIVAGGYRPYGLEPVAEEAMVPVAHKDLYTYNADTNQYEPGWYEVTRAQCLELTPEKMKSAIDRYLDASGSVVSVGQGIDFMFEKSGTMLVCLKIGDKENPAFQLLFECKRPDSGRRASFKDTFAYSVESQTNDASKVETIINLRAGAQFFSEHFLGMVMDNNEYNPVAFLEERTVAQTVAEGDEPALRSAVPGDAPMLRPYTQETRSRLVQMLNPAFQVEVAAAIVQHFNKTDRDL